MRIGRSIYLGILLGTFGCLVFIAFHPQFRPLFTKEYWYSIHRFATVLRLMKTEHVSPEEWDMAEVTEAGIQMMLRSVDPYSGLITGNGFEEFLNTKNQRYVGIGVEVTFRNDRLTVIAPFDGGAAQQAGIFPGDQIIKVDGEAIDGVEYHKVIEQLRGEPGTEVAVTVYRAGTGETLDFVLERRSIDVATVSGATFLAPGIAYLRISRFSDKTELEFVEQLARFREQGLQGLVIDLRNNPGGILQVCLRIVGHFYPQGATLLRIVSPGKGIDIPQINEMAGAAPDFRIAILLDKASASAAEIMAATLQESKLARVFGEPSFGKATVQSILELGHNDALRLTTAKYLTPGGANIAGEGVMPDVRTGISAEDSAQIFLQKSVGAYLTPELFEERFGVSWKEDVTLQKALDWLKSDDTGN